MPEVYLGTLQGLIALSGFCETAGAAEQGYFSWISCPGTSQETMMWQCHISSSECHCYRLNGFSLLKRLPINLSTGSRILEQSVGQWLESIGMPQYESKLVLNGFDDLRFMVSTNTSDPVSFSRFTLFNLGLR